MDGTSTAFFVAQRGIEIKVGWRLGEHPRTEGTLLVHGRPPSVRSE